MPAPRSRAARMRRCTSACAPTSRPRVGWLARIRRGSRSSTRARISFCTLPPESSRARRVRARAADVVARDGAARRGRGSRLQSRKPRRWKCRSAQIPRWRYSRRRSWCRRRRHAGGPPACARRRPRPSARGSARVTGSPKRRQRAAAGHGKPGDQRRNARPARCRRRRRCRRSRRSRSAKLTSRERLARAVPGDG